MNAMIYMHVNDGMYVPFIEIYMEIQTSDRLQFATIKCNEDVHVSKCMTKIQEFYRFPCILLKITGEGHTQFCITHIYILLQCVKIFLDSLIKVQLILYDNNNFY